MRCQALRGLSGTEATPRGGRSVFKLVWANWHKRLGEVAMDVRGLDGLRGRRAAPYDLDDLQRLFLFSRADTIYGGSDEVQRNILAERVLGLPREPKGHDVTTHRPEQPVPDYVPGHDLLAGKVVVVTAAAGAGIGAAVVRRALEEGAQGGGLQRHPRAPAGRGRGGAGRGVRRRPGAPAGLRRDRRGARCRRCSTRPTSSAASTS